MKKKQLYLLRVLRVIIIMVLVFQFDILNGQNPQYTFMGGTVTGNVSPFGNSTNTRKQWIFSPSNFSPSPNAGLITAIYFRTSASPTSSTYNDLMVRMGHTTLNTFTAGPFVTSGTDTVFFANSHTVNILPAGPWLPLTLQTPFYFNGTSNFIVDVSRVGFTSAITIQQQTVTGKCLYGPSGSATASVQDRLVEFGFDLIPATTDIGLEGFVSLPDTLCEGFTPITVKLKNYGPNSLVSAKIGWKLNNVPQATFNWSGSLPVNATVNVTIGSYPFVFGTGYSLMAYSSEPNTMVDTINGNDTIIKPEIIIKPSPGLTLQDTLKTICQGDSVLITGTLTGSPPWDILINDGSTSIPVTNITQSQFSYSAAPSSTQTYTLTDLSDATGCTNNSVYNFTVTVQQAPSATISPTGGTAACDGDSVTLIASIGLGFSYQWYLNGTPLPIDTNYVIHAKQGGDYTVKVTSPIGCSNLSAPLQVIIHPLPVVDLGNDTVLYPNQNIMLDAGAGYNSYTWSTGESSQTIVIDSAGTGIGLKTVWVRVTDNYSCPGTDTININFTQHPGISEAGSGGSLQIIPNPSDGMFSLMLKGTPAGEYLVEVFSYDGRIVHRSLCMINSGNESVNLDMKHLADGVYIIKVTCNDRIENGRIVIRR